MTVKIGPHVIRPGLDAKDLAKYSTIAVLLDELGLVQEYIDSNPNITIIGRSFADFTAESQFEDGLSPEQAANEFINSDRQKRIYQLNPDVKIFTGHNEPVWKFPHQMNWYSKFEAERLRLLNEIGLRGCIGNFSVGNPDLSLWQYFHEALEACIRYNGILGLHEYCAGYMWWMTNGFQIDPLEDEGDTGWTTLRYRKVIRSLPANLQKIKIAITETGCDRVTPTPPDGATGNWRDCVPFWMKHDGSNDPIDYWKNGGRDPEIYYAEQLAWYEKELRKDSNVIGATIFTYGSNNSAWDNYTVDNTRVAKHLIEYTKNTLPIDPPSGGNIMGIINPSFENGWDDVGPEQQQPKGWILKQTQPGQLMGIPQKRNGDILVAAFAEAKDEVVHKLAIQLPPEEQLGQRRALILDGTTNLKAFWGLPSETVFSTIVSGTPGKRAVVDVTILGESDLLPELPNTKLEDDTFWATVELGVGSDRRNYADMVMNSDVIGNERHWNIFEVEDVFPSSGQLLLKITLQSNWGRTNWFLDDFMFIEVVDDIPIPDEEPPVEGTVLAELDNIYDAISGLDYAVLDAKEAIARLKRLIG